MNNDHCGTATKKPFQIRMNDVPKMYESILK